MAVDQVSARAVQALNSAGTQEAGLRDGATIDGRVLAVNPDDTLRVATRYGQLDADPSQIKSTGSRPADLNELIGKTVKLEVGTQNAISGRYMVRVVSSGDLQGALADPAAGTADTQIAARIAADVAQAAAQQDGLAPVFAEARQLAAFNALPETVRAALADLNALALAGDGAITARDILNAFSASGIFLEAKLARLAAGSPIFGGLNFNPALPLANQDVKAALFALKAALDHWIGDAAPEATGTSSAEEVHTSVGPIPASSQIATDKRADSPLAASSFDAEALFAVLRPPPVVAQTAAQPLPGAGLLAQGAAQLASLTERPDLSTLAALGEWLQAAGQAPTTVSGRRTAYGDRPSIVEGDKRDFAAGDAAATTRPPPPRRGSLPQGQAAVSSSTIDDRKPIDLARDLAVKTANALARISLGQYASLPDEITSPSAVTNAATTPPAKSPASWLFEIPLRIAGSTSIAQFEIDQVFDGVPDTPEYRRAWRVQFSLDIAPMGPMHARLLLTDRRLSVGLWAEDLVGAAALRRSVPLLRQLLEAASFTIDEIHFASGRPPSGPPIRAGGFIDRNA